MILVGVAEPPRLPWSTVLLSEDFTCWPNGFPKMLRKLSSAGQGLQNWDFGRTW